MRFVVNGSEAESEEGLTVGAALTRMGIVSWRTTRRSGRPRGLFCGIGACFDCLVTVDGVEGVRACVTPVRPGMSVEVVGAQEGEADDA